MQSVSTPVPSKSEQFFDQFRRCMRLNGLALIHSHGSPWECRR